MSPRKRALVITGFVVAFLLVVGLTVAGVMLEDRKHHPPPPSVNRSTPQPLTPGQFKERFDT